MRSFIHRLACLLSSFVLGFWALTPVVFAAGNPNTGDHNKVGLVIGLLIASVVVIVLLMVVSAMKKKKSKH